ncbi:MAG: hypothetical protein PHY48_16575 [Candidatus Cloacimonetes bacterium]|nr:hypothetical protein [Candidatus Cloacimonadota bacterium]
MKRLISVIFITIGMAVQAGDESLMIHAGSDYAEYYLGEPVQLTLKLVNNGSADKSIDLGANGLEHISIQAVHNNVTNIATGPLPAGVSRLIYLRLPAGGTSVIQFFLDKIMKYQSSGLYELSISIQDAAISPARIAINVLPEFEGDKSVLNQRYAEYASKLSSGEATKKELEYIRKKIVYSRNAAALSMQKKMIDEGEWADGEYEAIVCALVDAKTPESIQILVNGILANPASTEREKYVAFIVLKLADASNWPAEIYQIIQPYSDEIESVVPVVGW